MAELDSLKLSISFLIFFFIPFVILRAGVTKKKALV